jgi:hypothetical protein
MLDFLDTAQGDDFMGRSVTIQAEGRIIFMFFEDVFPVHALFDQLIDLLVALDAGCMGDGVDRTLLLDGPGRRYNRIVQVFVGRFVRIVLILQVAEGTLQIAMDRGGEQETVYMEARSYPLSGHIVPLEFSVAYQAGKIIRKEMSDLKEKPDKEEKGDYTYSIAH